ncbi:MAG: GNAT family N-acetyltransferase [Oscillospiraceae bacterium]|nr:GNAT family N-acetyltransferase [Oscillospiraceae bacterium]MBQ8378149.1 GNAT family N-acetyltransferase [Oscillospiraceae bacterium]MBQ8884026.1 GNAT family N-acetyltransferase [Oscillospiraceae bacterium]
MSTEFILKEISKTELADCVDVIKLSFETVELPIEDYSTLDTRRLIFESDNGNVMFGLFDDEKQIGFAELDKRENEAVIKKLCVLPQYRGSGNGRNLLDFVIKSAGGLGYDSVSANLRAEDKELEQWFLSKGFEFVETRYIPVIDRTITKLRAVLDMGVFR